MAGSKGGKHFKGKGKSKSNTNQKKPETFDSKVDQSQISNKAHEITGQTRYTESQLEEFLYSKLKDTYSKAKKWLLSKGYNMEDIDRAFLNCRYFHGPLDQLLNNILTNSVAFIEQKKVGAKGEGFKDTHELFKTMLETLVGLVWHAEPQLNLQRADAMWLLLIRRWGSFPSTAYASHLRSVLACGKDDSAPASSSAAEKVPSDSMKVGVLERINSEPALVSQLRRDIFTLGETLRDEVGALVIEQHDLEDGNGGITEGLDIFDSDFLTFLDEESLNITKYLESCPKDPKSAMIVDLMTNIKDLQEQVDVNKEWAQRIVRDSAKKLNKDLVELRVLKTEKVEAQYWKHNLVCARQSCTVMLKETEFCLRSANCEARFMDERVGILAITNARIRAEIEALKLNASEHEADLNEVLNKERSYKKKVSNIEKQTLNFRAECDKMMRSVVQLQLEYSQAKKETEESEGKWKHEIVEKENMLALLAEEERNAPLQEALLKAQLVKVRQELSIKVQSKKYEHTRLENELSRLSHISLVGNDFLYNRGHVTSSSSCHWKCIFCLEKNVCIMLLPCTHQVLCARCYEKKCKTVFGRCPYCHTKIRLGIKVFGHSS